MIWQYTFTDKDGNKTVIQDEPVGWDSAALTFTRDADTHGMTFSFSGNNLAFVEQAYWLIYEEYLRNGVDGYLELLMEWKCDDCPGFAYYTDGTLNFLTFKRTCEEDCRISIGLNESNKAVLLKNRWDTSVDLGSLIAYDGVTALLPYTGMGLNIDIPSKAIFKQNNATTTNEEGNTDYNILLDADYTHAIGSFDNGYSNSNDGVIFPKLNNTTISELGGFTPQFQTDYLKATDAFTGTEIFTAPSEELTISNTYNINTRLSGALLLKYGFGSRGGSIPQSGGFVNVILGVRLVYGDALTDAFTPIQIENYIDSQIAPLTGFEHTILFDFDWRGAVTLNPGEKVYIFFDYNDVQSNQGVFEPIQELKFTLNDVSFFTIDSPTTVAGTTATVNMIYETGARLVESITNNELTFKSDFYGRTDSQPLAYEIDGCGSFRAFTNGLQLRKALLQDATNPNPFLSFKQYFEDQQAIDLVGIGVEENKYVRMEPIRYFYKDIIVFVADGVNKLEESVMQDRIYNNFKFGYDKYETESTNGLDAMHTKREYRIPIKNTDKGLEKYCKTIYDGYAIEVTKRKVGTTEDWRYDQNLFGFCLIRTGDGYAVEQGNITDAENMFDPGTVINFRVTPVRNAMRWFNWLMQGIRKVTQASRMLFNSGEGNYVAKGLLSDAFCRMEANTVSENMPIGLDNFADAEKDARPFLLPEQATFTYPLGLNEYVGLKQQAYGLVQYRQNPEDDWSFGWIMKLEPDHEGGEAKFTLVKAMYKGYALEGIRGLATEDYVYITTEGGAYIPLEGETIGGD